MKTVVNKTNEPLRIPLPRGKTLHLGPRQTGQIAHQDLDHKPLQRLVEAGKIEVQDAGSSRPTPRTQEKTPHESTHGHQVPGTSQFKGER